MKTFTKETLLDMTVSILHPTIAKHVNTFIQNLPETHPLREELFGYFLGPLSAWLRTQSADLPLGIGVVGKQSSDILNFAAAAAVAAKKSRADSPLWEDRVMQYAQEQIIADGNNPEAIDSIKQRLKAQIEALKELNSLLYPPSPPRQPIDWGKVMGQASIAANKTSAGASSLMNKFADWAETLPGAKPQTR